MSVKTSAGECVSSECLKVFQKAYIMRGRFVPFCSNATEVSCSTAYLLRKATICQFGVLKTISRRNANACLFTKEDAKLPGGSTTRTTKFSLQKIGSIHKQSILFIFIPKNSKAVEAPIVITLTPGRFNGQRNRLELWHVLATKLSCHFEFSSWIFSIC